MSASVTVTPVTTANFVHVFRLQSALK